MKQIEKIYNYILSKSKEFTKEELLEVKGFSAQQVGEHFGILRSNVSRELNNLCRERRLIKIKNRPVLYFEKEQFIKLLHLQADIDCEKGVELDEYIDISDEKKDKLVLIEV